MKLNLDCIRDILLATEENTGYRQELYISRHEEFLEELPAQLRKYDIMEVLYHIKQCEMAGLIIFGHGMMRVEYAIADLTPYGHEFLSNIRQDTNWNKTKQKLQKVGSSALSVVIDVAKTIIVDALKSQL